MKKICLLIFLATFSVICCKGYGEKEVNILSNTYGSQKYNKETVDFIHANGSVLLEETKVLGLVQVNGSLDAEESEINSLQVNGQVRLKNSFIINDANINGSLSGDNTKFQKSLSIATQKFTLSSCSVASLIVREVSGYDGVQIIDLRSGTKITGPIVVESGKGEIWLSSNSEVSGQITGAQIYKK